MLNMTPKNKFDYMIASAKSHGEGVGGPDQLSLLKQCGEDGWELVSTIPQPDGDIWFYFKKTLVLSAYNIQNIIEKKAL